MKDFILDIKDFVLNAVDTIKDPRYSWKFKVCNIITNDWLRVGTVRANLYLKYSQDVTKHCLDDEPMKNVVVMNLERAKQHIEHLWEV